MIYYNDDDEKKKEVFYRFEDTVAYISFFKRYENLDFGYYFLMIFFFQGV